MPGERALVGMAAVRPAVLVQVREPVELREAVGVILVHDVDLHLAEAPGELDLSAGRQVLRRKEQHLVAKERLVQALKEASSSTPPARSTPEISAPSFGVRRRTAKGQRSPLRSTARGLPGATGC